MGIFSNVVGCSILQNQSVQIIDNEAKVSKYRSRLKCISKICLVDTLVLLLPCNYKIVTCGLFVMWGKVIQYQNHTFLYVHTVQYGCLHN